MKKKLFCILLIIGVMGAGCDESDAVVQGKLTVELWGEELIEDGIPVSKFEDGYSVVYGKFLIALSSVTAAESENADAALALQTQKVWDLTQDGPFVIGASNVDVGAYKNTGYSILKTTPQTISGNVSAEDLQLMKDNEYAVYVEGTATRGTESWSFLWGFGTETVYGPCHSVGNVSEKNGGSIQITIHGDHLFYDSAVSETPSLRFEDFVLADVNGDGQITQTELEQYPLAPLAYYMVPGGSGIDNMWLYLSYMTTTLGHIDGEEHCETN